MAGRSLTEQLAASRAQRELAQAADVRQQIAQEAGLFGEVSGIGSAPARRTMAGLDAAQRRALAATADERAQQAQEAALFGRVAGRGGEIETLGGRQFDLQEELALSADERAQRAQEAQLFGQVAGAGGPIATLGGMQALEGLEGQRLAREATEAGLTGQFRGAQTAAERAQASALDTQDLQRRLAEAGVTGDYYRKGARGPTDTLQAQALESELQGSALQRALQRAGATGQFSEEGAPIDPSTGKPMTTETLESRLRTAGLTGKLDEDTTLAGRQAQMDVVGAALAAMDPEMEGRADPLARALIGQLSTKRRPNWAKDQDVPDPNKPSEFTQKQYDEMHDKWKTDNPQREGESISDYGRRWMEAWTALQAQLRAEAEATTLEGGLGEMLEDDNADNEGKYDSGLLNFLDDLNPFT